MRAKRHIANFFIGTCGLRRLHNSRLQTVVRTVLDEIDLEHLRESQSCQQCGDRQEMYEYINTSILQSAPIDFLEFGVFRGESMRAWSVLNTHGESRFYGF